MAQNVTVAGASYSAVPSVVLPKTGGGSATFTDVTDTTAAAADVASGKYFYTSAGVRTQGTSSGGGSGATIKSTTTKVGSSNVTSISFSSLSAQPKAFAVMLDQQSSLGSTRYVISVTYDGTTTRGCWGYSSSNTRYAYYSDSYFSFTYSSGTLTVSTSSSSNGGYFRSSYTYRLIYAY